VNALYLVAAWVPRRTTITIGALGPRRFGRGWCVYVGSAARGRDARVARHLRAAKPLRWHADYVFARCPATLAWLVDTELTECEVAARLAGSLAVGLPARGFGASDCGCAGHLLRLGRRPSTGVLSDALIDARVRRFPG
jgi:Uri superfamily endonuclease